MATGPEEALTMATKKRVDAMQKHVNDILAEEGCSSLQVIACETERAKGDKIEWVSSPSLWRSVGL